MNGVRETGILMPISALPSPYGIGTLGEEAYRFVDTLSEMKVEIWQMLPLLPTAYGDSPYQSPASGALNYYFIDLDLLEKDGLLQKSDYATLPFSYTDRKVAYGQLFSLRVPLLKKAFRAFDRKDGEWQAFLKKGDYADFGLFMSLKEAFGYRAFSSFPAPYDQYEKESTEKFKAEHLEEVLFWQFTQFLFLKQWKSLKAYANGKGVKLMGDMPIYVSSDSVEAWKYGKELFMVGEDGFPSLVAGVPPDYFSKTGQLWGNPVYDWEKMRKNGFSWWHKRLDDAFSLFDVVRIDHFRGFDRFFAIPNGSESAVLGEWKPALGRELFLSRKNDKIVAEDLGLIDDGVRDLMKTVGFPGMKVFEFGFDGNVNNEHLPSTYQVNVVGYTGTHDNMPLAEFLETEGEKTVPILKSECEKLGVEERLKTTKEKCQTTLKLMLASKAETVIFPWQDVLCLGAGARINEPSVLSDKNWSFRFLKKETEKHVGAWLKKQIAIYRK